MVQCGKRSEMPHLLGATFSGFDLGLSVHPVHPNNFYDSKITAQSWKLPALILNQKKTSLTTPCQCEVDTRLAMSTNNHMRVEPVQNQIR